MDREDMIALIEAFESFVKLNDLIMSITDGYQIANKEYTGIENIYDVIKKYSRYWEDDDESEDKFRAVMYAINATPEEKYELLKVI